jgi:hypothetical protein
MYDAWLVGVVDGSLFYLSSRIVESDRIKSRRTRWIALSTAGVKRALGDGIQISRFREPFW